MQAIDAGAIAKDDAKNGEDFDDDAVAWREVDDVVDGTNVEHHTHSEDYGQNSITVANTGCEQGAAYDSEKHGYTSHNGHRALLEFAGVGIIDEVLRFSDGEDLEIDPERHQH